MDQSTKTCADCGETKELDAFGRDSKRKDRKSSYCRACQSARGAASYLRNRDTTRARMAKYGRANRDVGRATSARHYARLRAALNTHKLTTGCMDCGYRANVAALEFDHRPGEVKLFTLGNGASLRQSIQVIWAEVAKCDVVCANCHSIRTDTRRRAALSCEDRPILASGDS